MAKFPALPVWTDAYLADTRHLSQAEHGAYFLLLMTAWRTTDCALPDDDRLLAKYAGCDRRTWLRQKSTVMRFWDFDHDVPGKWTQKRLLKERKFVHAVSRKRAEIGRKGLDARAAKKSLKNNGPTNANGHANAMQTVSTHTHTHTIVEEESAVAIATSPKKTPDGGSEDGRSKRGSRLPADWRPDQRDIDFATERGVDPIVTAEVFRDYWHAKSGANASKVDWATTWRVWVNKEAGRGGHRNGYGEGRPGTGGPNYSKVISAARRIRINRPPPMDD